MGVLLLILFILATALGVFVIFVALATIIVKKVWFSTKRPNTYTNTFTQTNTGKNSYNSSEREYDGLQKRSPTGWTFNEETQLWEPPDYLKSDPAPIRKKDNRLSFEQWKATREAEQHKDQSTT